MWWTGGTGIYKKDEAHAHQYSNWLELRFRKQWQKDRKKGFWHELRKRIKKMSTGKLLKLNFNFFVVFYALMFNNGINMNKISF